MKTRAVTGGVTESSGRVIRGEKGISRAVAALVAAALLCVPGSAAAATIAPEILTDELNADANCSLREAVQSLNTTTLNVGCQNTGGAFGASDTVALAPDATYTLTLDGDGENGNATGDLDLTVDMTITGNAADPPEIDADVGDGDRTIHVPGDDSLTLQSLWVTGGDLDGDAAAGERGGNIYFQGGAPGGIEETLTIDNATVTGGDVNTDGTNDRGGGIAADGGGQVTIQNGSFIQGNEIGTSISDQTWGAGIYLGGAGTDLSITGSDVSFNHADSGVRGRGGGIFVDATGDSMVNLTNTTVLNNSAGVNVISPSDGFGGGIAAEGGSPAITITGGSVSANSAAGGPTADEGLGGGIYVTNIDETLNLSGVTVSGNQAGGQGGSGPGLGGGIYTPAPLVIQNSLIELNKAGFDDGLDDPTDPFGRGGGIELAFTLAANPLTISNSTIRDNFAGEEGGLGGGVSMRNDGNLTVTDSVLSGNRAGRTFGSMEGTGGGIHRSMSVVAPTDSIMRSVIRDNLAEGSGSTRGGGVQVETAGTFAIRQSTVSGNTARSSTASGLGGGLYLSGGAAGAGAHTIENVTVHGNLADDNMTANGGSGGGISVAGAGGTVATNVGITHSTIASNTADPGTSPGGGNLRTFDGAGSIDLRGSIVAYGIGDSGEQNCSQGAPGDIDSLGFNVEGQPSTMAGQCSLDGAGDLVADPLLAGALANNGGPLVGTTLAAQEPLMTRAITTSSPAFNRVTSGCPPPTTDQIGTVRPSGGACDSGAFELFVAPPVITPTTPPATAPTTPTTPPAKKKCKKKKKKKGAAAAKKCKRKKR